MNTLQKIFYFEWLRLKKSNLFLSLVVILTILFGTAFYTGMKHVQFRKNTIEYIQKTENKNYEEGKKNALEVENNPDMTFKSPFMNPTNPVGVGWRTGNRVFFLEPKDLSFISIGDSDFRPNYYKTSLFKKQTLFHNSEIENSAILYNKHFDLGFVLIFILPLVCIALTYNISSYDRENGTMGILLSGVNSFRKLVFLRFLFRGIVVFLVCLVLLILGLVFTGNIRVIASMEFFVFLLIVASYLALWCGISYWVGSFRRSSSFNVSLLAAVWLLLVILLPSVVKEISVKLHPMPSKIDLIAKERAVADSIRQKSDKILSKYMDDHPELVVGASQEEKNRATYARFSTAAEVEKVMKPLRDFHDSKIDEQEYFIEMYRFVSPAIMTQKMLDYISGNSRDRYQEFDAQFLDFREEYKMFFIEKIFKGKKFKSTDYDLIPKREFKDINREDSIRNFIINILIIVCMTCILIVWANINYKKI